MRTPGRTSQAVLILLVGLVAGCATTGGEPGAGPGLPVTRTGDANDTTALPVDHYGYTALEVGQLILAQELLVSDCLRRRGSQTAEEPDRAALGQITESRLNDLGPHGDKRRYSVTEPEAAATYGYRLPSTVKTSTVTSDNDGKKQEPESELSRGCLDEATKAISGSTPPGNAELVKKISWESYEHSLRSPRLIEALEQWSSCMRTRGFDHATPMDAAETFTADSGEVASTEIATAVADASCKQETQLVDTWRGIEEDYQEIEVGEHREELDAARVAHDQCVERAMRVIAEH